LEAREVHGWSWWLFCGVENRTMFFRREFSPFRLGKAEALAFMMRTVFDFWQATKLIEGVNDDHGKGDFNNRISALYRG
jgi:hypothetical protein